MDAFKQYIKTHHSYMYKRVFPDKAIPLDRLPEMVGKYVKIDYGNVLECGSEGIPISSTPKERCLYVGSGAARFILPSDDFTGRHYRFMRQDCATLMCEYVDAQYRLGALQYLSTLDIRTYKQLGSKGFSGIVENFGYVPVSTIEEHDIVFYMLPGHVGVAQKHDKILHHIPGKFSSIDEIDQRNVLGVYRYGKSV